MHPTRAIPVPNEPRLATFVSCCKEHFAQGDEKSESQSFLNEFFRAFGYESAKHAGAEFEYRVDRGGEKGHKGYADLVWKPRLLVEMKSRGANLKHHYDQLERYWMRLAPKPKYSILSNFDEFWIFDFNNQVDAPVDVVRLEELPNRASAFGFMYPDEKPPVFQNNQVEITERNAQLMGQLYRDLSNRAKKTNHLDFDEQAAQRFVLQCVLAMFAEDRGLLPCDMFVSCLEDCIQRKGSSYDILGGLFNAMNQRGIVPAGRYRGVDYFNGGLFAKIHSIELSPEDLKLLEDCAKQRWDLVRPSIFGSIFESAIDPVKRHAHGVHFTSEADIRQIVIPTITEPWEDLIAEANTKKELNILHRKLRDYKVLDAACGAGNFLYVAYQELKKIELRLLDKLSRYQTADDKQLSISFVTPNQFYGMDINPFAIELARVTMMIARKIAIDHLELIEPWLTDKSYLKSAEQLVVR